jgi:hypothetical protein
VLNGVAVDTGGLYATTDWGLPPRYTKLENEKAHIAVGLSVFGSPAWTRTRDLRIINYPVDVKANKGRAIIKTDAESLADFKHCSQCRFQFSIKGRCLCAAGVVRRHGSQKPQPIGCLFYACSHYGYFYS